MTSPVFYNEFQSWRLNEDLPTCFLFFDDEWTNLALISFNRSVASCTVKLVLTDSSSSTKLVKLVLSRFDFEYTVSSKWT